MSTPSRRLSLVLAGCALSGAAVAQDSVSINTCDGDAVSPWADVSTAGGSEQADNYVVDLTGFNSSLGTRWGIAPILKPNRSNTGFFSSAMSSQAMSQTLLTGVNIAGTNFSAWRGPGFGINNNPAVNTPGTATTTTVPTSQFAAAFAEFGTTDLGSSYNGITAARVNFAPAVPGRLYVSRVVAATNSCDDSTDLAQFGLGGVDSDGNVVFRADAFNLTAGCGGVSLATTDNYIWRVDTANRDPNQLNVIAGTPALQDATTLVRQSATTHNTPTLVPSSITGGAPRYIGSNFDSEFVRENSVGGVVADSSHFAAGVADHRGGMSYMPQNWASAPLGFSSTLGVAAILGLDGSGEARYMNLFGLDANTDVEGTPLGLLLPAVVQDNLTGFAASAAPFDNYGSQAAFRGGNGQVGMTVDQDGRLIAAAQADHPTDGGGDWPINFVAVARVTPSTGAIEWTMAGYNDGSSGIGGTGKPIENEDGDIIGRMVTLDNVTGGAPFGPSVSSPMVDAVGNVWFYSAVELFLDAGGSDFDVALLRAVYDPDNFSYSLELITTTGNVFTGVNSQTDWQVRFLGVADFNSISSGTAFSGNMGSFAFNDGSVAGMDTADPRTNGGVVLNMGITYDRDGDGDFTTCFNGGADEDYTALVYIGNIEWPNLGKGLAGTTEPKLSGEGLLIPGENITLRWDDHIPNSATNLVVGLSQINAPFKGGTLCPKPDFIIPLPILPDGTFEITAPWIAGVPPGFPITLQSWNADAGGPNGFSATNAIQIIQS